MPLTSNAFYLSNAEYVQEKKRVCVEFSNLNETRRISFPFVPSILIHNSFLSGSFMHFVNSSKGIKTEKINNGIKISCSDFSFLECLNSVIQNKGILLSPERQFLVLRNWSFFDSFGLNKEIEKKELNEIPEIRFSFASDSLKENISEMLSFSRDSAKSFLNKLVLSNVICIKLTSLPLSKPKILDSFIELILFRNNFAFEKKNPKFDSGFNEKHSVNLKKVDFSFVWPALFSFPFYNLGFDSVNCSCCKPENLDAKNILPSSLVEVKFTEDAIYFDSSNTEWSSFFHSIASEKEKRIRRKNEWNLKFVPAGPFFRNDVLRIPFTDAFKLKKEKKVVFLGEHDLHWSCRKKESFISSELNKLNKKISFFEKKINEFELNSIKQKGIAFSLHIEENPEFNFFSEYRNVLRMVFSSLPFHLSSVSSAFFDFFLSNSIKCIFSSVLEKFREFSLLNSSSSYITKNSILIDSDNVLDLLLGFSKTENLPIPELNILAESQ